MIPVMLFGVLFAKKKYGLRDYFCVALITAGIVTFNLNGKSHNKKVKRGSYTRCYRSERVVKRSVRECHPLCCRVSHEKGQRDIGARMCSDA